MAVTECLYLADAYLTNSKATVVAVAADGIVLDKTVFYPRGGGQPGDTGVLEREDGSEVRIADTRYGTDREILHVPDPDFESPSPGEQVVARIDWDRRFRHMRMHSALHFLGVALPFGVTGGSIGETHSRLDFDMAEPVDKADVGARLNALIGEDHQIETIWTDWEELDRRPELIRTMSVKPPRIASKIRLLKIADLDLQPCGGTHVRHSAEIGRVTITKTEKKGSRNRRVYLELADS